MRRIVLPTIVTASLLAVWTAAACADGPYTSSTVSVPPIVSRGQTLPATLLKPDGAGPFPAVVVLHDCSGLGPSSSGAPARWGVFLVGWGYVVLIPDSFAPRGYQGGVCAAAPSPQLPQTFPRVRVLDAYASLVYLRTLSFVDGQRVAIMGGSHGGNTTLATLVVPLEPALLEARRNGFTAGVALYPGCGSNYGAWSVTREHGLSGKVTDYQGVYQPLAPLLILIGSEDDASPAEHCRMLAQRSQAAGYPVSIKIYDGAYHGFDSITPRHFYAPANNPNSPTGHGYIAGGDRTAWADAVERVKAFFATTRR